MRAVRQNLFLFFFIGFIFFALFSVFWLRGYYFLDPDFGWHLRFGQIVIRDGIPMTDQFSYTMPSYQHVNHEWLADVFLATFYPIIGIAGLSGFDALLVLLTLVILVIGGCESFLVKRNVEVDYLIILLVPLLLAVSTMLFYARVRYQSLTWLFLAVLFVVRFNPKLWKKWRFSVPLMFLVWCNLHGGYAAGILVLVFSVIYRLFRDKKLVFADTAVVFLSIAGSFINPYGARLWGEVWSSVSDINLRHSVQEWMPAFYFINIPLPFWIGFSFLWVGRYWRSFESEKRIFYLFFLMSGILVQRNMPLWIVVSLPMTIESLIHFYNEVKEKSLQKNRFRKFIRVVLFFCLAIFLIQSRIVIKNTQAMSEDSFYPKRAIAYLQKQLSEGEVFSSYDWGGYLIWKLPQKRVFVDGRMPSWRWVSPISNKSFSAFEESRDLIRGEVDYREVFSKYGIETVLWRVPQVVNNPSFLDRFRVQIASIEIALGLKPASRDYAFLMRLANDGWIEVYRDSNAVIYQNPDLLKRKL